MSRGSSGNTNAFVSCVGPETSEHKVQPRKAPIPPREVRPLLAYWFLVGGAYEGKIRRRLPESLFFGRTPFSFPQWLGGTTSGTLPAPWVRGLAQ
jgi:hypothetical protein